MRNPPPVLLLFKQGTLGLFKYLCRNHKALWRVVVQVVHRLLHVNTVQIVLRLSFLNGHRSALPYEGEQLWSHRFMQPQAPMRPGVWVNVSRMEPVPRFEFTPVPERVPHEPARLGFARFTRQNRVSVYKKTVRVRALLLLLANDREIAARSWILRCPDAGRGYHQKLVPLHHIDMLLGERDLHLNF